MTCLFKSLPENWIKEQDGRKSNTLRKIALDDPRYEALKIGDKICIINTVTYETFEREITDITLWEGWTIISWRHPNE